MTTASRLGGFGTLRLLALLLIGSALIRGVGVAPEAQGFWRAAMAQTQPPEAELPSGGNEKTNDASYVLEALAEREVALEARERALAERSRTLELAEEEVIRNLAALEEAETALRETLALADGAAAADLERLTDMYQNMKPKDAAALFETMDPNFAAGFLAQMSPATAGAIMAGLQPETAYTISLVLAGRNMRAPTE